MENRLYKAYKEKKVHDLKKQLGLKNIMQVPRINKININAGIGSFKDNREASESFVHELAELTGQKPYYRKARLSEAGFKIKKGDIVGYAVTLRGSKMWAFLDKLINIVLPRVRDFRGLNRDSFDENGNYSLGIREHVIFPEVNPNATKGIRSLQVTIVMNSNNKEWNTALLENMGFPFKKV
ncbi:50S ribosomal protein L5 [candidate division WWE3 bacterium RIFCSPLOWO2_01_FULL_37_15]|uniref:Large ribosomal subunit protein uL5 n=1 Tax=candidate division WWE3 bacterium RIFCSPLOWO2_01_FULL_37_15 TaxID=1802622 RepID=A0A1F4V0G5_UNCKA|nr:MAG: 50S ribosomal protein L5 [candidate division WWE3 bacterium RIFCSPLOWO2_01_FULL_37_15]